MAAYASLVSLMSLIHNIQNHPHPPISLDHNHFRSLWENITFLQEFLEVYSHYAIEEAADGFESRIACLAYAAANMIEYYIEDQIKYQGEEIENFYPDVQKVTMEMDFVTKEAMEIKHKIGNPDYHQLHRQLTSHGSKAPPLVALKNAMVGFDHVFDEVLDKLTGDQSCRQIIPIVGMGGIGKTTLAINAYQSQLAVQHFDIRSWVVVSQDSNVRDILLKLLDQENNTHLSDGELGKKLYQNLYDRRYLVVMDDVWSVEVWNEINRFFPENNNRSRIIVTTRLSFVASELSKDQIVVDFLDDCQSWKLLCNVVFGEKSCPTELEESGRKIAEGCKGLPLSIIVMGGLLAKSKQTQEDWMHIVEKLNSSINFEYEDQCLQVLHTSFDQMPIHLKPCFLYMGIFPEDSEIRASNLIKMWVGEGFIKPICGKSLELAAEEYLMDLVDRNLILVELIGSKGKIKVCKMHDVTRDLSIKEAKKERFLCILCKENLGMQQSIDVQQRIVIERSILKGEHLHQALDALRSASPHCMVCNVEDEVFPQLAPTLRILKYTSIGSDYTKIVWFLRDIFQLVCLRSLFFTPCRTLGLEVPSSMYLLWNLQTLIFEYGGSFRTPLEIWKMYQLRHIKVKNLWLSNPPQHVRDHMPVLQNLQTLSLVRSFRFGEEVVKRIPNIRKLKIICEYSSEGRCSDYHLGNLGCLQKLESLYCCFCYLQAQAEVFL